VDDMPAREPGGLVRALVDPPLGAEFPSM
jgi:hypothetical protein